MTTSLLRASALLSSVFCGLIIVQPSARADNADEVLTRVQLMEKEIAALKKENEGLRQIRDLRKERASLVSGQGTVVVERPSSNQARVTRDPLNAYATSSPVYVKAEPTMQLPRWTGAYAGLNIGYGQSAQAVGFTAIEPTFFGLALGDGRIPGRLDAKARGFIGGIQAGYNYQAGPQSVVGFEADISYSDVRGTNVFIPPPPGGFTPLITTKQTQSLDWFGTFRGRAGILATPSLLAYVTGGLAFGRGVATTNTTVSRGGPIGADPFCGPNGNIWCSDGTGSKTLTGWTVGGGLEQMIGSNWSVKAEYLYYDLGHQSYTVLSQSPAGLVAMQADASFRGHIGRFGLNYKFNTSSIN